MGKARVIYWFRTDLRLHDSPALNAALELDAEAFWPVWTWDVHYVRRMRVGSNRFQFLLECQADLSASLTKLNPKLQLFLLREPPQTLFPKLFKAWGVTHLVYEKDTDTYAAARDATVAKLARDAGVTVLSKPGRTLWDSEALVKANGGKPTMSISQVQQAAEKLGPPAKPLPAPTRLPDPGETPLDFAHERPEDVPDIMHPGRTGEEASYAHLAGPDGDFGVPTLAELGLPPATSPHRGGETAALKALQAVVDNAEYTATFEKPKTAPTAVEPAATTLLSPHLHFGSLSVREFYWRVQAVLETHKGPKSSPPTSLIGQLQFRDMYFGAQQGVGAVFGQTFGNARTRFVPWHLPSRIDAATGLVARGPAAYDVDNAEAEAWFRRWKYGRTGFPWIDALMRQLRREGWIHHLGRHAVACFLTRGGCYVDWERGAEVFEEWLLDHEPACNIGNWQWLSCTAFYAQFYRCYSPIAFPQKWDKDGDFVRRYVPELARFDKKYIYEPWRAPIADQEKWGCRVDGDGGLTDGSLADDPLDDGNATRSNEKTGAGRSRPKGSRLLSYPKPMFDFSQRREICIEALKTAYSVGLYGDSPKVKDGSWRKLFDDAAEGPTAGKSGPGGATLSEHLAHEDDADDDDDDDDGSGEAYAHETHDGGENAEENSDGDGNQEPSPRGTKHKRSESAHTAHSKGQSKLDFKKAKQDD